MASERAINVYKMPHIIPIVLPDGVQEGFFNDAYHVRSTGNKIPDRLNSKYTMIKTKIADKILSTSKIFAYLLIICMH